MSNGFAEKQVCMATTGNSNTGTVSSVTSRTVGAMNSVVGQLTVDKNVSVEAEDIVGIHH
jgi:hypothetical protein